MITFDWTYVLNFIIHVLIMAYQKLMGLNPQCICWDAPDLTTIPWPFTLTMKR